ncbi:invasion associated locus B family protein [Roseovarius sp. EL26]|uniref:invasion associated locus B family protein n=1 Tax=Roseovarius sp. EL26 TaxID=2126672 RepID=UPI000EA13FC3|nr:invasion associated locus B family protein [Roseovarius sp. EL26]
MKYWGFIAGAVLSMAQPVTAQEETRAPWLVNCNNQADTSVLLCEMSQSIVLAESNQRLATAAFVKAKGTDEIEGRFTLPFGLYLPGGLTASVDKQEIAKFDFLTCEAQGCYAITAVSADWFAAMKSGAEMTLSGNNQNNEPISFGFDLTGFSQVSDLLP